MQMQIQIGQKSESRQNIRTTSQPCFLSLPLSALEVARGENTLFLLNDYHDEDHKQEVEAQNA